MGEEGRGQNGEFLGDGVKIMWLIKHKEQGRERGQECHQDSFNKWCYSPRLGSLREAEANPRGQGWN